MWDQKIPSYIYGKQNIVRLILWTALFALVFINIYKPFSSTSWYKVSEFKFFVFSSLIILTGVLVVVLSRIILFHWGKRHAITVRTYAIWIVLEIFFMSLFYTIYTLVLNPEREYMEVFNDSAVNTSLVLLLPIPCCTCISLIKRKSDNCDCWRRTRRKRRFGKAFSLSMTRRTSCAFP